MIKFFRQIRYNLMEQNKTSKYLKYAIGEIILVVIGILIALSINNWNENRKAEIKQQNLFTNLKTDFESRLLELKEFNLTRQEYLKAYLELNNIIANLKNRPDDNTLDGLMSKMVNGLKFNEEFKMLDALFSTGLINDLKNEKLKRKLIEWPQQVEEMLEEQRMHNQLIDNTFNPLVSEYVSIRAIYEKFDFRKYNLPKGEPVTLKKQYDKLLSNPRFENYLALVELVTRVTLVDTNTLIESAEEIIKLLNEEL